MSKRKSRGEGSGATAYSRRCASPSQKLIARLHPLVLPLRVYLRRLLPLCDYTRTIFSTPLSRQFTDQDRHSAKRLKNLGNALVAIRDGEEARRLAAVGDGEPSTQLGKWSDWAPPSEGGSSMSENDRLLTTLGMAQAALIKSGSVNLLTLGYRPADERENIFSYVGGLPVQNTHVNDSISRIAMGPEWTMLHKAVGAKVMIHLLVHSSIFMPIEASNDCWTQVCGVPLSDSSVRPLTSLPAPKASEQFMSNKVSRRTRKRKRDAADVELLAMLEAQVGTLPTSSHNIKTTTSEGSEPPKGPIRRVENLPNPCTIERHPLGKLLVQKPESLASFLARRSKPKRTTSKGKIRRSLCEPQETVPPTSINITRSRLFYGRSERRERGGRPTAGFPAAHEFNSSLQLGLQAAGMAPKRQEGLNEVSPGIRAAYSDSSFISHKNSKSRYHSVLSARVRHVSKHIWPEEWDLPNVWEKPVTVGNKKPAWRTTYASHQAKESAIASRGTVRAPKRLQSVKPIVRSILQRHDVFNYRAALGLCCPSSLNAKTQHGRDTITAQLQHLHADNLRPIDEIDDGDEHIGSTSDISVPLRTQAARDITSSLDRSGQAALAKTRKAVRQNLAFQPSAARFKVPTGSVCRFVHYVIKAIIPVRFFGSYHNQKVFLSHASRYVLARRFENFNAHEVMQGMHLSDVDWVLPASTTALRQRPTVVESTKRRKLFTSAIFWLFESFLTPLLRTTFYVTEASALRYQVLYFRQDDWARITYPVLQQLKNGDASLFEHVARNKIVSVFKQRKLGFSGYRLLPKATGGFRLILNLGKRQPDIAKAIFDAKGAYKGATGDPTKNRKYGIAINNQLRPALLMLTCEKKQQPDLIGASVFGMTDILARLQMFKEELLASNVDGASELPTLFAVKVDVQRAFDSIVHDKLLEILRPLLRSEEYSVTRHSRIFPTGDENRKKLLLVEEAHSEEVDAFEAWAESMAAQLRHAILVDGVTHFSEDREKARRLLTEHVGGNLVQIGSDFFRQRIGIAQGSCVSTLLCCLFYAALEREKLLPLLNGNGAETDPSGRCTRASSSLLMRYTDDFLLLTTSKSKARAFFASMVAGHPEYSCRIVAGKSLINFDELTPEGGFVPRLAADESFFPWAGQEINIRTLAVRQTLERYRAHHLGDSLTVHAGRKPGSMVFNKLKEEIKRRTHPIYVDRLLNSSEDVHANIYRTFVAVALKMHAYLRALRCRAEDRVRFVVGTMDRLAIYAYNVVQLDREEGATARPRSRKVKMSNVIWLAHHAFFSTLSLKPEGYRTMPRGEGNLQRTDTSSQPSRTDLLATLQQRLDGRPAARRYARGIARRAWKDVEGLVKEIHF